MRMHPGEDIEFYADRYEERQEVLRSLHEEEENSFPEEDERESRKTLAQVRHLY